ncbi:hypothetical protein Q4528_16685, partial [Staphylococcus pasteuri_A]|nr:hypothetical protein [Staphylococcus pasteuri_A]
MTVDDLHSRYTEANWMSFVTLSDNDNMEQLCTNAELVTDQINKEQLLKIIGSSIKHLSEQEQLVLS